MPVTAYVTTEEQRRARRKELLRKAREPIVAVIFVPGGEPVHLVRVAGGWEMRGDLRLFGVADGVIPVFGCDEADAIASAARLIAARGRQEFTLPPSETDPCPPSTPPPSPPRSG
jgi:hypothetical protein